MSGNRTVLQDSRAEHAANAGSRLARVLVGTATIAILAAPILGAAEDARDIQDIGAGRKLVIVEPHDAWQPENFSGARIISAKPVTAAPVIDGQLDDAAWDGAAAETVPLAWGTVREATIRAVYTRDEVFIAVSWPDWTRDDQHHPWVWDAAQGRYTEGPQIEDALLVSIEGGCDWNPSLLANQVYDFDAWVWMAARTNPLGQAVDADGSVRIKWIPNLGYEKYTTRYPDPTWNVKFIDQRDDILTDSWQDLERMYKIVPPKQEVYVAYPPDGGRRAPEFAERIGPPSNPVQAINVSLGSSAQESGPETAPQYRPVRLTGDAGEVAARGHWADGRWTVEFRRTLVTDADTTSDSVFQRTTQFSVQVFDHVERLDETSESGRLFLKFEPAEERQAPEDTTVLATR
jgi:hypothetical protein